MKRLAAIALVVLPGLFVARADPAQPSPLADSVKVARSKVLEVDQVDHVRAVASALIDAKQKEAEADQRNALGLEMEQLRQQLSSQRRVHLIEPIKVLGIDAGVTRASAVDTPQTTTLKNAFVSLRSKRIQLEPLAEQHPALMDAVQKASQLESELAEIAALVPEEQGPRINELANRLTPHRASEFAAHERPQPTLVLGHPAPNVE